MSKTKVLFCVSDLTNAGPTAQLYNIIKYLDRDLFDIILVTIKKIKNQEKYSLFSKIINIIEVNSTKKNDLRRVIENFKPDYVQTSGFIPDVLISKIQTHQNFKQIITVRSNTKIEYVKRYGRLKGFIY